jgi:Rps23 Pro-64 3,4-dihydroxylase Tpa1-like proline 4-hydroxylase
MICIQEHPLTEYLTVTKPFVPTPLIDQESWEQIEAIAQYLPSQSTNFFGFEWRLGESRARADLLLCMGAGEPGQAMLAGSEVPDMFLAELFQQPIWAQIREFAACWHNTLSPLHQKVSNIWLEFDVDKPSTHSPIPSCFFGSNVIYADPLADPYPHTWITRTAIRLLQGASLSPVLEQQVFRSVDALPLGAYVFQVGLMLARGAGQVRLCIRGISTRQIIEYLDTLGWSGCGESLQNQLWELSHYADRIDLDLDIGETGIAPKIGLECYLNFQPKLQPKWSAFLQYLVTHGLCLPEKQEALLAYPGFVREKTHRDQFPAHLLNLSNFLGNHHEVVFMRGLHHIKVVYQADRAIEAKAYGWVSHRLLNKQSFFQVQQVNEISVQIDNFLTNEEYHQCLEATLTSESSFLFSQVLKEFNHNEDESSKDYDFHYRHSLICNCKLPELTDLITQRIQEKLPDLLKQLGIAPFLIAPRLETQLTAHNDGHYFKPHVDDGVPETAGRMISFVYYFYREPKLFTGGQLRVFNRSPQETTGTLGYKLIEPRNNSIVFFPSRYIHEVLPVNCPSKAFADSKFTINGWIWEVDSQTAPQV